MEKVVVVNRCNGEGRGNKVIIKDGQIVKRNEGLVVRGKVAVWRK